MPYSVVAPDGRKLVIGDDGSPLQDTPQNRSLYGDLSQYGAGAGYGQAGDTYNPATSYFTPPGSATVSAPKPGAPQTYAVGGSGTSQDGRAPAFLGAPLAPAAPGAPAPAGAAPPGAAAAPGGAAPGGAAPGVYAVPGASATGDYGAWLNELRGYAPADLSNEQGSHADQLNAMLAATKASRYLSPFYVNLLKSNLNKAEAGYNIAATLGGTDAPTQEGTGAAESFGQYMQDQLVQRANQGLQTSGWGPHASGIPLVQAFTDALERGHAGTGTPAEIDAWEKYNATPQGRQILAATLGAGVEGPFAGYRRDQLGDQLTNAAAGGTDTSTFFDALRDWESRAYGRRR